MKISFMHVLITLLNLTSIYGQGGGNYYIDVCHPITPVLIDGNVHGYGCTGYPVYNGTSFNSFFSNPSSSGWMYSTPGSSSSYYRYSNQSYNGNSGNSFNWPSYNSSDYHPPDYGSQVDNNTSSVVQYVTSDPSSAYQPPDPWFNVPFTSYVQQMTQAGFVALYMIRASGMKNAKDFFNKSVPEITNRNTLLTNDLPRAMDSMVLSIGSHLAELERDISNYNPNLFLDRDGLIEADRLSDRTAISLRLACQNFLTSKPATSEGSDIREIVNRCLLIAQNPAKLDRARETICYALAADAALNDKDSISYKSFIHYATITLDIALGFIPVISSVNDGVQIFFGLITGKDYTGNEMSGVDYLIRAIGIVIGINPYKALVLGTQLITKAVYDAISLIRKYKLGETVFKVFQKFPHKLRDVVEVIGNLFPIDQVVEDAETVGNMVRTIKHLAPSLNSDVFSVERLIHILNESSISIKDKLRIISSFEIGSLKFSKAGEETLIYRWHTYDEIEDMYGRFYSFEKILDKTAAMESLALPSKNGLKYLDQFKMPKGMEFIEGIVAPNFSHAGGAKQIFIFTDPQTLIWQNRLKHPLFRMHF
jgi:hypothetical protein